MYENMHTLENSVLASLTLERNGVPIYVQVREQLLRAISTGVLAPGARMPTLRQVAVALKIDLNTVRHAYEDLRRDGFIDPRQGLGSFVVEAPALAPPRDIDDLARHVIAEAATAGIDPIALAERIAGLTLKETS